MKRYFAPGWEPDREDGVVAYLNHGEDSCRQSEASCCHHRCDCRDDCRCDFRCCCPVIVGPTDPTGPTGPTGPKGDTGATGPTGTCVCSCRSIGEMVTNGGMEQFQNGVPVGWSTTDPAKVEQSTAQGRVHTGNSGVNLSDGGDLFQDIRITGGCWFDFSFFARGQGAQVSVEATVTFRNDQGLNQNGLTILVRRQDMPNDNREFAYYRNITGQAPAGATTARLRFVVSAEGGQSMDLDDVSFAVN